MIMDIISLQSIQQQLNQRPTQLQFQRSQYYQNLKSQCLFKQNALKTAESLIEQYNRQNEDLKLEVLRLNQKIQNYEEKIYVLQQKLQDRATQNNKSYQKELFKSSFKLSNVLQKYSELQAKYHKLEKQLFKYKQYKKQEDQKHQKLKFKQQQNMKVQVQKQFNHFLRTPVNKYSDQDKYISTTKKSNFSKIKHSEQFKHDPTSESEIQYIQQQNYNDQSSSNEISLRHKQKYKDSKLYSEELKRQIESKLKIQRSDKKSKQKSSKKQNQKQNDLMNQKLKIFEWKLKQKDEQIMLMLRRNKLIQSKYQNLKQVLNKHQQSQKFQKVNKHSNNTNINQVQKNIRKTLQSDDSLVQIDDLYKQNRKNVAKNVQNDYIVQKRRNKHIKNKQPVITKFNSSLYNDSTQISTWKNYPYLHE